MAGFAIHMRVFAIPFLVKDVSMAGFAALMAGEIERLGGNFKYCLAPIVPILSEAFWDQEATDG
jgi:hypothetical protein